MKKNKKLETIINSQYKELLPKWGDNAEAIDFLNCLIEGKNSIFLTGKAGTGKSELIKDVIKCTRESLNKNPIVLGSTGIAALNIGGQTVHSYFNLGINHIFYGLLDKNFYLDGTKKQEIIEAPFIVIDEISMLSSSILDCLNKILSESIGNGNGLSFGGKQIIFVGDVLQLAPVEDDERKKYFDGCYNSGWFFDSHTFLKISGYDFNYKIIELLNNYRAGEDKIFKDILNRIRENKTTDLDIKILNSKLKDCPNNEGEIILSTHRYKVDEENEKRLKQLNGNDFILRGYIDKTYTNFPDELKRVPDDIIIKEGARIMMVSNDPEFRWVNGSMGYLIKIIDDNHIVVKLDYGFEGEIGKAERQNTKYMVNSDGIIEKVLLGKYYQFPIQLAYAITIHKSQGLTFESSFIDIADTFTGGQAYTALSRLRCLDGLSLKGKITKEILYFDPNAYNYYKEFIKVKVFDGNTINKDEANKLSKYDGYTLKFPNLKNLTKGIITILAEFGGEALDFGGLEDISDSDLEFLCQNFKGKYIILSGINGLTNKNIKFLQDFKVIDTEEFQFKKDYDEDKILVFNKDVLRNGNINIFTEVELDKDGYYIDKFDGNGINKLTKSKYGVDGYDEYGRDKHGFGKDGYYEGTDGKRSKTNPRGFLQSGIFEQNGTIWDNEGYDIDGYNEYGFNRALYHRNGGIYDEHGFDSNGKDKNGNEVDKYGCTQEWYLSQKKKRFWIKNSLLQGKQYLTSNQNKYLSGSYSHDYGTKQISILFKANGELIWTQYEGNFLGAIEKKDYDGIYEWDTSQNKYKLFIYPTILGEKSTKKYYAQEQDQNKIYIEGIGRFKR